MSSKIYKLGSNASRTRSANDDELCDRLSSRYTVVILVIFSASSALNSAITSPMTCWAPTHFTKNHVKFANNYCWIKNTYYVPWNEGPPTVEVPETDRKMVTYYQWIPFILVAQAILFYLPRIIWHGFNSRAGVDADNILSSAHSLSDTLLVDTKERTLTMLVHQLDRFLISKRDGNVLCCCKKCHYSQGISRRRFGNYLLLLFIFSKVCYIVNVIGQMFLLNVVLSIKYNTFGFDIAREMTNDKAWFESGYVAFPRVTLCDFEIRGQDMTNVQRYTIQCVLPMNMFNEKIFMFLWYWMVFVACASCVNLFLWILKAALEKDRIQFIRNQLSRGNVAFSSVQLKKFIREYLRQDGCLLLRLISHNSGAITTQEIASSLFHYHFERQEPCVTSAYVMATAPTCKPAYVMATAPTCNGNDTEKLSRLIHQS